MGLKLHGEDATKATNLQALFTELKALDRANGKEDRDFFQIEFPPAETPDEERQKIFEEIRERVIQLFAASALLLTDPLDKQPRMRRYVPVPGQAMPYFDQDDFSVVADDIRRLLEPTDPCFQAALADREVGTIQLLGRTFNFANDHGDPRAAFKHLQKIASGVQIAIGSDLKPALHELTELSWEGEDDASLTHLGGNRYRQNILRQRLQEMIQLDYHLKNPKLVEAFRERFPKQEKLLTQLVDSYNAATLDLGVNDFKREEWFHVLFSNLVNCAKQMNRGLYDALKKLSRDIRTATQAQQISDAINVFMQQTLPAILPPSSSSALSAVSLPEPAPKSS